MREHVTQLMHMPMYIQTQAGGKILGNKRESKGTTGLVLLITIFHLLKHSFAVDEGGKFQLSSQSHYKWGQYHLTR